jgi:hypothetical protein
MSFGTDIQGRIHDCDRRAVPLSAPNFRDTSGDVRSGHRTQPSPVTGTLCVAAAPEFVVGDPDEVIRELVSDSVGAEGR